MKLTKEDILYLVVFCPAMILFSLFIMIAPIIIIKLAIELLFM